MNSVIFFYVHNRIPYDSVKSKISSWYFVVSLLRCINLLPVILASCIAFLYAWFYINCNWEQRPEETRIRIVTLGILDSWTTERFHSCQIVLSKLQTYQKCYSKPQKHLLLGVCSD
ncbi:hypothetical protein BDA96_07G043800 [Sorghum bicolor]|uniref:Uncharacterized protein n=2 Tax=Sorghum bicolor TaxID=4558 RepID=A0A1B6PFG6_SORBI|nr:hypothetical protein BDA96_07G043800 [Sorghum bicolor]KXG24434.1 hypothetical protein SORBI_3007G041600 [Sorghum bicolor]